VDSAPRRVHHRLNLVKAERHYRINPTIQRTVSIWKEQTGTT
jgi:hypothetical protein